jgi:chorismate-pyruvate lyase
MTELFPLLVVDDATWPVDFSQVVIIPPSEVPQPYHKLLVHHHHMTVTLEEFFDSKVDVQVLQHQRSGESYSRQILLSTQSTGQVIQFGTVRINLACCSPAVREGILSESIPLGRVLIQNEVLRRIEPTAFLRISPGPKLVEWFKLDKAKTSYGRMGVIFCDDQPAIAVLEILAPIESR